VNGSTCGKLSTSHPSFSYFILSISRGANPPFYKGEMVLKVSDCGSRVSDCGPKVSDCGPKVSDCGSGELPR